MNTSVAQPILSQKNIKDSMLQLYPYSTIWGKVMLVINIYLTESILSLFFHQDTESAIFGPPRHQIRGTKNKYCVA